MKKYESAGVIEQYGTNGNGSITARVQLDKIDRESNGTNFRKFLQSHTKDITDNFNFQAVRNPVLAYIDGRLKSIDGRHTIAALLQKGYTEWTADIHFEITAERAAAIFFELTQNSKRMGPWDAHAAALEGKYAAATVISKCLKEAGFTTPKDDDCSKTADFPHFSPIKKAAQKGEPFLKDFLLVMKKWKNGFSRLERDAQMFAFQSGLIELLAELRNTYSAKKIAGYIGNRTAAEVFARAIEVSGGRRVNPNHVKTAFKELMRVGGQFRLAA